MNDLDSILSTVAEIQRAYRTMLASPPDSAEHKQAHVNLTIALARVADAPDLPLAPRPRLSGDELDEISYDPFDEKNQS